MRNGWESVIGFEQVRNAVRDVAAALVLEEEPGPIVRARELQRMIR